MSRRPLALLMCAAAAGACGGRLQTTSAAGSPDGGEAPPPTSSEASLLPLDDPNRTPFTCSIEGSTTATSAVLKYPGGNSIVADSQFVYLTDNGDAALKRANHDGTDVETIATNQIGPYEVHLHGTRVCWRDDGPATTENTTIWCSSTTAFSPTQVVATGDSQGRVFSFDFDDHDVYYVFPPSIYRVPIDGSSSPTVVATDDEPRQPFSPMSLRARSGLLYWASVSNDGHGSIRRCAAAATCTPEILATFPCDVGAGSRVVADDTHIYWTTGSGAHGDIFRMPLEGGTPSHLVSCDDMYPNDLSVDSNHLYWAGSTSKVATGQRPASC